MMHKSAVKPGETNPEITDGKIRHKPKIADEYIQGFKESPEHNEGKYRESQQRNGNYKNQILELENKNIPNE